MATETLPSISAAGGLDEFAELETKIERVAAALLAAREERDAAVADLAELATLRQAHEKLQRDFTQTGIELAALRHERSEVHQRVSRLVKQLDAVAE